MSVFLRLSAIVLFVAAAVTGITAGKAYYNTQETTVARAVNLGQQAPFPENEAMLQQMADDLSKTGGLQNIEPATGTNAPDNTTPSENQ